MLAQFAKLIGVRRDLAEDALHSERAAKHVLSRRDMFGTMAAMAAGVVMPLPLPPVVASPVIELMRMTMSLPLFHGTLFPAIGWHAYSVEEFLAANVERTK